MRQLKIKEVYPIFADGKLPDYPIELFADGQPAALTWKWEFVRHTDEDSDEPPEGTNHLRIDVKTEWLLFDPSNLPEAREGYTLLLRFGGLYRNLRIAAFTLHKGQWIDWDNSNIKSFTFNSAHPVTYKLIKI